MVDLYAVENACRKQATALRLKVPDRFATKTDDQALNLAEEAWGFEEVAIILQGLRNAGYDHIFD